MGSIRPFPVKFYKYGACDGIQKRKVLKNQRNSAWVLIFLSPIGVF